MLKFILLLAWPLFRRYLYNRSAEYTANFLNRRREQRLQPEVEEEQMEMLECPPAILGYSNGDVFWFTLSGVLLGSALGVLFSYLTRQEA